MSPTELTSILNLFYLTTFVIGVFLGLLRLTYRVFEYRRARWDQPFLLRRDLALFLGLGLSFLLIAMSRAFGWQSVVAGQPWWTVITSTPGVAGVWYWVYIEYFKLNPKKKR